MLRLESYKAAGVFAAVAAGLLGSQAFAAMDTVASCPLAQCPVFSMTLLPGLTGLNPSLAPQDAGSVLVQFIVWAAMVHGVVIIVTISTLLEKYREWVKDRVSWKGLDMGKMMAMSPEERAAYTQSVKPPGVNLLNRLFFKLINCWICVSFWTGFWSALFGVGPFYNPIIGGVVAVGVIAFYRVTLDTIRTTFSPKED
jgi:hypothetical protein